MFPRRPIRVADIVNSTMDALVAIDEEQRIIVFNHAAEKMFGYRVADVMGKSHDMLLPERFRAQHWEHIRRFGATSETHRRLDDLREVVGLRANGEEFPVEISISQTRASPHKIFTAFLRDITERRRAEQAQRHYTEQLRRLSRRLFAAEEAERRRLARELHDRAGANLTALTLNFKLLRSSMSAQSLERLMSQLDDNETLLYATGQLIRDVMNDLRPPGLDQLGLLAALTEHARQVATRSGISVTVRGVEPAPRLPPETEITLFRIAQEALTNVAKHAQATEVTLALEAAPEAAVMTVSDNGRGFEAAAQFARSSMSMGMVSVRERAEALGGRLRVESAPGQGTRIIVEVPRAAPTP